MNEFNNLLQNGIETSEILNPQSTFIMTGYWWGRGNLNRNSISKLTYDQQVDRIITQCKKLRINYYFVEYPAFAQKGMYQLAINLKIQFMINTLDKFPGLKVIMIDTDLNILQFPVLFEMDADCFFINWNSADTNCFNPYELLLPGGIMGFSNSHNAKTMLKLFNTHLMKNKDYAEDKLFSGFITRKLLMTYLRCVWLPYNYMYMYSHHTYVPHVGYTKILSLEKELQYEGGHYKPEDIVIEHADFETGALDDVFDQRVTKNRFPPRHEIEMGTKLRCFDVQFDNYLNYNMTRKQCQHVYKDTLDLVSEGVIKNKSIIYIKPSSEKYLANLILNKDTNVNTHTNVVFLTLCDDTVPPNVVSAFKKRCIALELNYIIYTLKDLYKVSHPILISSVIKKYNTNVVYIDIYTQIKKKPILFNAKNMDFMTINLDNTNIDKKCSDIRILHTLNDKCYFFANNRPTLDFINIWNMYNKVSIYQHKYLEYAFNISMSINKLRCYWLPREYLNGTILHYPKHKGYYFNTYPDKYYQHKIQYTTKHLQQCGNKPALKNGDPQPTHYHGSGVHGTTFHNTYGKLFLQF